MTMTMTKKSCLMNWNDDDVSAVTNEIHNMENPLAANKQLIAYYYLNFPVLEVFLQDFYIFLLEHNNQPNCNNYFLYIDNSVLVELQPYNVVYSDEVPGRTYDRHICPTLPIHPVP